MARRLIRHSSVSYRIYAPNLAGARAASAAVATGQHCQKP
jgi:hypothetical protein